VAVIDAQRLALADRTCAVVVCGSAVDSFPDPARALAEVHRVLRPGGSLGLWVAPAWWWQGDPRWAWHDDLLACLGADVEQVPAGLDGPASLRQMIRAAGFRDVRVRVDRLDLWFPTPRRGGNGLGLMASARCWNSWAQASLLSTGRRRSPASGRVSGAA
jgi:SAM-dependent methyltransferase